MTKVTCHLISHSASPHLSHIYTGFLILYKTGLIHLSQTLLKDQLTEDNTKPSYLSDIRHAHLSVVVNNSLRIHYDTNDSREIDEEYLNQTDYYFKRSYSPSDISHLNQQGKILPLGLIYHLYPSTLDKFGLDRSIHLTRGARKFIEAYRALNLPFTPLFTPRMEQMQALPDYNLPPKILFMVQAWDPYNNPDALPEKIAERQYINQTRENCIKLLKEEFGDDFYGGFIHTEFSTQKHSKYLLPDNRLSKKKNYINLLKNYPIAIATTGLHGSTGWKFAEYIAFSKAIVSERLNHEFPGDLENGKNYIEFNSPEECVHQVKKVFCDHQLRKYIMINNSLYYFFFLKPDSLVMNTLLTALSKV